MISYMAIYMKIYPRKAILPIQYLMEAISFERPMNDYWFSFIVPKTTENNPEYFLQSSQSDRHL